MKKNLFSLLTALLLCLFCAVPAFAEMPLVMDTYTHTTETETYDPVKDNSSSSGSSTDSDGFGGTQYLLSSNPKRHLKWPESAFP